MYGKIDFALYNKITYKISIFVTDEHRMEVYIQDIKRMANIRLADEVSWELGNIVNTSQNAVEQVARAMDYIKGIVLNGEAVWTNQLECQLIN
jgi:hypothetical protein